jgi:serine/threonine-protein kinase RsbW
MVTQVLGLSLRNDLSEIARLAEAVTTFGNRFGLPAGTIFNANLALEELVTNVVTHDASDGLRQIEVSLALDGGRVVAVVEDDGPSFDPFTKVAAPDLTSTVEDRAVGGLGVHLVRSLTDEARYERVDGRNRVTIVLHVDGGPRQ